MLLDKDLEGFRLAIDPRNGLLAGLDDWHFRPLPEQELPPLQVADCGHGVTVCTDQPVTAICLPTGIGMASTWNTQLIEKAGRLLGEESRRLGISMLLGPMINLHRLPLNGRSFETFSEDPVLAGKLGAALIRGIQSTGTGACLKALAVNNQQKDQHDLNVVLEERVLRELYLLGFEIAVKEANPLAVMTAYNRLHGVNCAENRWLISRVVKGEWQFPGVVMSDWRACESPAVYSSGLDVEMPGPGKFLDPKSLRHALSEGWIEEVDLADRSQRVFRLLETLGAQAARAPESEREANAPAARKLARELAEESIVLLRNEGQLLPIEPTSIKRLAVIGPNAAVARLGGGGSASVTPVHSVSPYEGFKKVYGTTCEVRVAEGCGLMGEMEPVPLTGGEAEFYVHGEISEAPNQSWPVSKIDFCWGWASPGIGVPRCNYAVKFIGQVIPPLSGCYRLALHGQEGGIRLRVGERWLIEKWMAADSTDFEGAYRTRSQVIELDLQEGVPVEVEVQYGKRAARAAVRLEWELPCEDGPLSRAERLAGSADAVVLCLGLSNLFEGGAVDRKDLSLPPVQVELLRRVLKANPRTILVLNNGGPLEMPWAAEVPALLEAWYPGQEGGEALARICAGMVNPSGRLPDTIAARLEDHAAWKNYPGSEGQLRYEEGLMIGYRHFDHAGIEPQYPFGFGLSYTRFEISVPKLSGRPADGVRVQVSVKNCGTREGQEVVQVYVKDVASDVLRPPKELKAFAKVRLAPGETREVQLELSPRDFSYWHPEKQEWLLEAGIFKVGAGPHSRDLRWASVSADRA